MEAIQITEWGGDLKQVSVDKPEPRQGEALLKVKACGVGLTVCNIINGVLGEDPKNLPRTPGHEICGEIVEIKGNDEIFEVGDRFITYFYLICGKCRFCSAGRHPLCENFKGFIGLDIDGGYAEYVKVPIRNLIPIPDDISDTAATAIPDAIATPYNVSRKAEINPDDTVMVLGAGGGVGIHMVQMAKLHGATVIGVDLFEEKLEKVREVGGDYTINNSNRSIVEEAEKVTGEKGVDTVIDFVGDEKLLKDGLRTLGKQGKLVNLTTFDTEIGTTTARYVLDEITITGSRYASKAEVINSVELVRSQKIEPVITEERGINNVQELHKALTEEKSMIGRGVLTF